LYGRYGMSERGAAAESRDHEPVLGDQPTLAASPGVQASVASGTHSRGDGGLLGDAGDWTGREIGGRYVILNRLGEGGMGVVYVAEHLHLKKRVAFKVIHPDLAAHEELLLRFKREALATGQLDHPHIAAAIDFGELDGGGAFMVMPLVRGVSLQVELDQRGKLDPRRAARIGAQIADALSAAHAVGIVHRDLKPDNVLLERRSDGSESAKVLDFGVASLAGRPEGMNVDARPLTQAGTILGTPGYMSPEQASAGAVDHRTDLYALGVILWELLRGERLFDGENITQIFAKQFKSLPPALELGLALPARELSALVARLLAWDKSERPDSASEVRDALRRIAELPESSLPRFSLPDVRPLLPYRRHLAAGLTGIVLFLFFSLRGGDEAAQLAPELPETSAPGVASASGKKKAAAHEEATLSDEEEESASPSEVVHPVRTKPLVALPEVFREAEKTLTESRSREARRSVAKRIGRSRGVPRYLELIAELELTDRCAEKKELVAAMRAELDPRVLPTLERLADQPRRGCGLLRINDCLSCLRRDLDQTIGVLQHTDQVAPK
jgi:eukaryotic-like serine/threonine-protein kinase